jgi:putative tricarboxylic transport membrane protein
MKRTGYSPAATVMGVILSPIADNELIRMFQMYGSDWYMAFVTRPIAASILALLIATLAWSAFSRFTARRQRMLGAENGATP